MPSYYTIEEFSERRKLQDELRNAIDTKAPGYEDYVKAMEDLNKKMNAYSALDQWGVAKQIDEAGKQELIQEIKTTALAGEKFLKNIKQSKDQKVQELAGTVRKLQGLMSHDMNLLQQYDPNGPEKKSLPELQEDARTATVDIGKNQFDKISGQLSERIPMTIQDAKGKKIKGFFTKGKKFSVRPQFDKVVDDALKMDGDKEFLKDFLNKYRTARLKKDPKFAEYTDEYLIAELYAKSRGGKTNFLKDHLENVFGMDRFELNDKLGMRGAERLAKGLERIGENPDVNLNMMLNMKEGARMDQRNTAMSAVADLLGVPNLIARSRNMRFRDENGNIVEGTFMDVADGTDLAMGTNDNALKVSKDPFSGTGKEGLRQLCDLQVLDYICGNIDRHAGNLVFQLDKDGKIIGVQGIDNDTSFTSFAPQKKDLNDMMTAPANMRIMSRSMAERVKNMDPAMLKFTLRGRGLSEEEMDAAVERLKITQAEIKKSDERYKETNEEGKLVDKKGIKVTSNHLYVMDDDKFDPRLINYLRRDKSNHEPTSTINEVSILLNKVKQYQKGKLEKKEVKPLNLKEFNATERELLWSKVREKVGTTSQYVNGVYLYSGQKKINSVDDLTNSTHGSSPQWDTMVANMKALNEYNEGAYRKDRPDQLLTTQEYLKTRSLWHNLDTSADAYLAKKMKEKGVTDLKDLVGKNDYEKDRIEYAKKIKAYTTKHRVEALTDHQKEILKQHDEGDIIELNKKMKEEALKLQEEQQNKGPQAGI